VSHSNPEPQRDPVERIEQVRAWGARQERRAQQAEARLDALQAEIGALRRSVALWRAGIKPGPAASLFLDRMPVTVDLDDVDAVRQACAGITAAVLDGHRQLAEATP
jgi:hypothetical protein